MQFLIPLSKIHLLTFSFIIDGSILFFMFLVADAVVFPTYRERTSEAKLSNLRLKRKEVQC